MFQLALGFTLILFFNVEETLCDGDKPFFLRFVYADHICNRYVPFDRRCQGVKINYEDLESYEVFMFDIGLLRFYVYTHRTYTFFNVAMADFHLKIRWQEESGYDEFSHQNRFTLIYNRHTYVNNRGKTVYRSSWPLTFLVGNVHFYI